MNEDGSETHITINRGPLKRLMLKTEVLLLVTILPLLLLGLGQDALIAYLGAPIPSNLEWIALFSVLLIWYIVAFALVLPPVGRYIDSMIAG